MNSLISIITPTFNRAFLIRLTLDSVLAQTYPNWECIIVDDGSFDNSEEVISTYVKKDCRFKYFKRPPHKLKGANVCRNFGVEMSKGEFLIFLDSDDLLIEDCLKNRITVFKEFPMLQFAVFSMGLLKNNEKIESGDYGFLLDISRETLLRLFISGEPLPWNMTRPIWKKDFFLSQGGFNEKLKLFDDDEFNFRVVYNENISFKFFDYTDCYYRISNEKINKYKEDAFLDNLLVSHLEFLKSINRIFNSEDKIRFKKELQFSLVMKMREFLSENGLKRKKYKKNAFYFFKNFQSSYRFKVLFWLKYLALAYSSKRKGGYTLNKIIDSKLECLLS